MPYVRTRSGVLAAFFKSAALWANASDGRAMLSSAAAMNFLILVPYWRRTKRIGDDSITRVLARASMITKIAISGYRSLRNVVLAFGPLNVVTGPNGSGKSSLYRALHLLADVAQGRVVRALAVEGGLNSTLWAGPESFSRAMKRGEQPVQGTLRSGPVSLKLGFGGSDYGYAIDLGLPIPSSSEFSRDPVIKTESLWTGDTLGRSNAFAIRNGASVRIRDKNGEWRQAYNSLAPFDSMMTHAATRTTRWSF